MTVQCACATKGGGYEAMMGWLVECGHSMPSSVDGYRGHGEGVEDELFIVLLLVLAEIGSPRDKHKFRMSRNPNFR